MTAAIHFSAPASGFDDPLGLWLACHQRVRRFVAMLDRLAGHVARSGADEPAQQAAAAIRRYFNEAAPHHHEDEELDLFPLLRERTPGAPELVAAIERLEADHLTLAAHWRTLDTALARLAAGEPAVPPAAAVAAFAATYDAHIEVEETVLLPAMRAFFAPEDWRRIGAAMAERRGILGHGAALPPSP
jgi:hemerythrin-like domain-containing protein